MLVFNKKQIKTAEFRRFFVDCFCFFRERRDMRFYFTKFSIYER